MFALKKKWLSGAAVSAIVVGVLSLGAANQSFAQSADRLKQGFLKGPKGQISLTPKSNLQVSEDETEIFSGLKGIVIVNDPGAVADAGTSANGVEPRGDFVPDAVIAAANQYVGQSVSLASLDRMTRDMVLAYREAGFPVVNVVVPPQDVSNKVVQIVAVVGRLGQLSVEGSTENPEYYSEVLQLAQGDAISEDAVISHLRWKSRRANRRVNAIYSPGDEFSATDITLDVKESKPWSVFIGADNTGPGSSGDYRFFPGFVLNDVLSLDDEFSYQFTTSEGGFDELASHVLQYTMPVAVRSDLQLTAAFSDSFSTNAVAGGSSGESTQYGATLITQHDRAHGFNWDSRLGFEYKDSNNAFEFGGVATAGARTTVGQFFGVINGDRRDSKSATNLFAGLWYSPGDLFDNNTNAAFDVSRAGAVADYTFVRAGIDHTIYDASGWSFNMELEAQIAQDRLLGSELMYLGGMNTVRGFQESVVRGDNGLLGRFELISPSVAVDNESGAKDDLRWFGFYDVGSVSIEGVATATEGSTSISGAGVGFRYASSNGLSAELAYGWKIDDSTFNTTDNDDGEFHFRVIARH